MVYTFDTLPLLMDGSVAQDCSFSVPTAGSGEELFRHFSPSGREARVFTE